MNSMPFRQLKSFLKILIGVQYEVGTGHFPGNGVYQNRHRKEDTHEGLAAPYGRSAPGRERREPRRPDGPPRKDILSSWRMIARHHTKPSPERGRWAEGPDEVASQPSPYSQGKAFFVH